MKSVRVALLGLFLASCVTVPGPKPPVVTPPAPPPVVVHALTVHVCDGDCAADIKLPGTVLTIQDSANAGRSATTDASGNATITGLLQAGFTTCAAINGFVPQCEGVTLTGDQELSFALARAFAPVQALHTDGRIFRTADGQPWRWAGVTGFRLLDAFAHGTDLQPFFDRFHGFNTLRVFLYAPWKDPSGAVTGWDAPDPNTVIAFLARCQAAGFRAELVLFTDNDPARVPGVKAIVDAVVTAQPINALIEIGNEPDVNSIDTTIAKSWLTGKGVLFSSGDYADSSKHFGDYLTYHTPRDSEWPRKSKALREFWDGGGPDSPSEPAIHKPAVADEPIRPDESGYVASDYLAYFGTAAANGAGATFHYEGGKWARLPDDREGACLDAALAGLNAFPVDAANGAYSRPDDSSLRTYIVGNTMVRVRPTTLQAPQAGWTSIEPLGILWKR